VESAEARLAWEEIYIAEGSDWCWWYGDDHSSANDQAFDYLFRKHLMNVYAALGAKVPDDLKVPIKPQRARAETKPPVDFITPKIDGKTTSYFEWQAAGKYIPDPGGTGTMHRAQNLVKAIYYGYDLHNLYFRLDLSRPLGELNLENISFKVVFLKPEYTEALIRFSPDRVPSLELNRTSPEEPENRGLKSIAAFKVVEWSLPLSAFGPQKAGFEWVLVTEKDGQELERWPAENPIFYPFPAEENFAQSWSL
jgi:hypothetical protein